MNQHEIKHYQFPRTTREAFGAFIPMRGTFSFINHRHGLRATLFVVALLVGIYHLGA